MSKIAILSHETVAAELAILGEWANLRGHAIERFYREATWKPEDLLAADLIIIFGSPNSVSTGYEHPTAKSEIELVKSRLDSNEPFFGICYGSQVMAKALGGEVERREDKNIGFKTIAVDSSEIDEGGWMLWHEDFIVPESLESIPGVEILGTDAGAAIAFRKGSAWAVQFHPEVDGDALGRMIDSIGVSREKWGPVADAMNADDAGHKERAFALFDRVLPC